MNPVRRFRRWILVQPFDPVLLVGGLVLVALGLAHGVVQWWIPRDWESPIGWRKPILFGLSTGVTLLSLSWVLGLYRRTQASNPCWHRWLSGVLSAAALIEVGIITAQTWRGVPAHFNIGTTLDRKLTYAVDGLLVLITAGIVWMMVLVSRERFARRISVEMASSIRLGMALLVAGCLLGFGVAAYGMGRAAAGLDPHVVPPSGVPKFPHGMPLHGIQLLPAWAAVLRSLPKGTANARRQSVRWLATAISLATAYALWQAVTGHGRFDFNAVGFALLLTTFGAGFAALWQVRR